jgi:O-antigen ligase
MEPRERGSRRESRHSGEKRRGKLYWRLDFASEVLIYTILTFSAWAFGTTEQWSIESVTELNFVLGGLLLAKWIVKGVTGFRPERWDEESGRRDRRSKFIVGSLAILSVLLIAYCGIAAWNARAVFSYDTLGFTYFEHYRPWLPHSYDQASSWMAFQVYFSAACFFWSVRDWLITKSRSEIRGSRGELQEADDPSAVIGMEPEKKQRIPARLRRLLWFLCLNGSLLALQGSLQRLSGSNELLWMVRPRFNSWAHAQFGPFNYRSNAAQYLNMLWPVALGFAWSLHQLQKKKLGQGSELVLFPLAGVILAGPMIANSRGGAAIALGEALAVIGIFAYALRRADWRKTAIVGAAILLIICSASALEWQAIQSRLAENSFNSLSGRREIYENAYRIVADFPLWGTGPGTFSSMYYLYRVDPSQMWMAMAHDDFLQTLVTFGSVGLTLILIMIAIGLAYPFVGKGMRTPPMFSLCLLVAISGCLIHARFDFPMQLYSLFLLFLTVGAISMSVGRS